MNIVEKIINEQGETIVERKETNDEQQFRSNYQTKIEAEKIENESKAKAKDALLQKLGITEDEAKLLLS